jgi:hypothetical protein
MQETIGSIAAQESEKYQAPSSASSFLIPEIERVAAASFGAQCIRRDAALTRPYDRSAATVDANLPIERCDVISYGIFRQFQMFAHVDIALSLTYQGKDLALPLAEKVQVLRCMVL